MDIRGEQMIKSCPNCGYKNRVHADSISYRCEQCSRVIKLAPDVEDLSSLFVVKKSKVKKVKPVVVEEPIVEEVEEPIVKEESYD